MNLNPEFRRNLWLQMSPQRLVAAPVVLGALFAAVWLATDDAEAVATTAIVAYYFIAVLWGTRRAADTVAEEVNARTWDGQRMSSLGAWAMTWGKFAGGTAFIWYAAVPCLGVYAWAAGPYPSVGDFALALAQPLSTALVGQVVAMAASLMFLAKQPSGAKLAVTFSQLLGLAASAVVPNDVGWLLSDWSGARMLDWYGYSVQADDMALASTAVFVLWGVLAIYRLMRAELQFRSWPWAWLAFVLYLMLYVEGYFHHLLRIAAEANWLLPPLGVAVALVYAAALVEAKDIVRYRWFAKAFAARDFSRAAALVPLWLPTYLVAGALAIACMGAGETRLALPVVSDLLPSVRLSLSASVLLALLAFMLRDLALVMFLNFGTKPRRADMAAVVYLVLAYGPLPVIAYWFGLGGLPSFFLPVPAGNSILTVAPAAVQALVMLALLRRRWREAEPVPAGWPA